MRQELQDAIVRAGLKRMEEVTKEIARLETEHETLLKDVQACCSHPENEIVEGVHQSYSWSDSCDPPFRVCRVCGYNEPGWGCGYFKLAPENYNIPSLSREEARKYVRGRMMTQEEKGVLFKEKWDRQKSKLVRNMEDPESREFWEALESRSSNYKNLPAWVREAAEKKL